MMIEPRMTGVRLSFALMDWKDLGQKYPTAMDKLQHMPCTWNT